MTSEPQTEGVLCSNCLSAGSEEDLDEEGLGRRAVTAQVIGGGIRGG